MMAIGRFYGGVAAVIRRESDGRYLLLKRSREKDFASGVWECVTGRVNEGEGFEEAAHREVYEETKVAVRIEFLVGTTHFFRGDNRPENELIGVVFACTLADGADIRLSAEHSDFRWVAAEEVGIFVTGHEPSSAWIKRVIARTEDLLALYPAELIAFNVRFGFGLDLGTLTHNR